MNSNITTIVADYIDYIQFDVSDIDMSQVKEYGIKWGTLYLVMKDGTQISREGSDSQGDYKWPIEVHMYDEEHYPVEEGDEEE